MEMQDEESLRRARGRKIDPQTNQVYHMEDSPPPEDTKDAKLLDRLQTYSDEAGNEDRLNKVNKRYEESKQLMFDFTEQFGLVSKDSVECKVPLNMQVKSSDWDKWNDKEAVKEAVQDQIKKVIAFKQEAFDEVRERVHRQIDEEERLKAEEEERLAKEQELEEARKSGDQSVAKQEDGGDYVDAKEEVKNVEIAEQSKSPDLQNYDSSPHKLQSDAGIVSLSHGATSRSMIRSSKLLRRVYEITDNEKIKRWE